MINYFEGESIKIKTTSPTNHSSKTKEEIEERYISGEVRIITEQARYPLDTICSMLDSGKYDLHPEFQRRRRWNRAKQSKLIESFIMNIPIPPILLYEVNYAKYEVMDGLQRLIAISEFYMNVYSLEGLEFWPELNGMFYRDLPGSVKSGIDRRYLSSLILLKETASTTEQANAMKQIVFDRINSGGAKLEYQESRNALYPGHFNELAVKLSRNEYFRRIFDIPIDDSEDGTVSEELANNQLYRTMADVELVIRFFSMRYLDSYEGISMKEFFDRFTEAANKLNDDVLEKYFTLFNATIKLAYDIYGNDAFCLYKKLPKKDAWYMTRNATKVIYDPVMFSLSQRIDYADGLIERKDAVVQATMDLMKTHVDSFNGRKGTKQDIKERISLFNELFDSFLS